MGDIDDAQRDLIEEFSFFDNWVDRYQYIIDMGRKLPEFPEQWRTDDKLLAGCQSKVWLHTNPAEGRLDFQAISDSAIVSGLIAILMRVYSGRDAAEILNTPPSFINEIGLDSHLSPTRSNGLNAMIQAIKAAAGEVVEAGRG